MTDFIPPPIPWMEFPLESGIYFVLMGVAFLFVFAVGCLILTAVTKRKRDVLAKRIGHFALFLFLFLVVGALFNGLWSCVVYNLLYHSTDYIFDFIPFWPITWIQVDTPWGDGHGKLYSSLFELRLVWLLFAICTWGTTILLHRASLKRLRIKKVTSQISAVQPCS
jgi:hypothetical protein